MTGKTKRKILKTVQYGHIISTIGTTKWYEIPLKLAYYGIRKYQKSLFGKDSNFKDSHTTIYLPAGLYSTEPPKSKFHNLIKYMDDKKTEYKVYRFTKKTLTPEDIEKMQWIANILSGRKYDYGQLINILMNGIMGYEYSEKIKAFDFGSELKVCSVSIACIFQKWRVLTGKKTARLFSKLNPKKWDKEFIEKFNKKGHWDVENTTPGHFVNSGHFDNEFELILHLKNGRIKFIRENV